MGMDNDCYNTKRQNGGITVRKRIFLILLLTCLVALVAFHARAVNTSDYVIDEGMLIGDVNVDERVNVSDVTTLINMILNVIPKDMDRGDINGDSKLNVSDVTALVNIILSIS